MKYPYQILRELEDEVTAMAIDLTKGMPPEMNITPYMELARNAILLGCTVTRNPKETTE